VTTIQCETASISRSCLTAAAIILDLVKLIQWQECAYSTAIKINCFQNLLNSDILVSIIILLEIDLRIYIIHRPGSILDLSAR
jgi:hypothetical protein